MYADCFLWCAFAENNLPPCDGAGDLRASLHSRFEQDSAIAECGSGSIERNDCVFLRRYPASGDDVIDEFGEIVLSTSLP